MTLLHVQSIDLPDIVLTKAANKSAAHRALANLALTRGLVPVLPPQEKLIGLSLHLHADVLAKLQQVADAHGLKLSAAFAALVNAGLAEITGIGKADEKQRKLNMEEVEASLLLPPGTQDRPDQMKFWKNLASGLMLNKVTMVEASTGVGKGKGIISAAIMCARRGKVPVIIAAPTTKILAQLWSEYAPNDKAAAKYMLKKTEGITAAFLPGRHELVDEVRLCAHLAEFPDERVQAWVDAGGPVSDATALSSCAAMHGITLRWLMSDLRLICSTFRAEDFALSDSTPPESEGAQINAKLREAAAAADIVFCTQTMLALVSRFGWSLLPRVSERDEDENQVNTPVIICDEAHLLEEAMAKVASDGLSLFRLRVQLNNAIRATGSGKGSALAKAVGVVRDMIDLCRNAHETTESLVITKGYSRDGQEASPAAKKILHESPALLKQLNELFKTKGTMQTVEGIRDYRATVTTILATMAHGDNRLAIEYSPHWRYPMFSVGPANVKPQLSAMWNSASGGAALVSATFWLPSWDGSFRVDYMRDLLALPIHRLDTPPPVEWKEIYHSPVRYVFSKEMIGQLVPPEDSTSERYADWCQAQGRMIARFNVDAVGGTLVLCTSYQQVRLLSEAMVAEGIAPERIVVNSGRLIDDQERFVAAHTEGLKPLWLVLGPGWAGVDLVQRDGSGMPVPSELDTLLTDLVVTRIPFGLNRSVTMQARMEKNFKSTTYEAMLRLKQGLGRLIRRQGLKGRRLLVLDGRLEQPGLSPFMAAAIKDVHLLLGKYVKRRVLGGNCR